MAAAANSDSHWKRILARGREEGSLVGSWHEGSQPANLQPLPAGLHPKLLSALKRKGVEQLYGHQADACELAGATVVTTSTSSGKSLCFQLPLIQTLLTNPGSRALLIYPTKALAQDQARSLHDFGLHDDLRIAVYDGDTPKASRTDIRKNANVIITNPDMLHMGILPNAGLWTELFARLAIVVVDEAHAYRGVFGSHVSNVLRRLRRSCSQQNQPRFILTTATIANPAEHAEALTGIDSFALIDEDGSPNHGREIAIWNPPLLDKVEQRTNSSHPIEDAAEMRFGKKRVSALEEAANLLSDLIEADLKTICFVRSRKGVELVARMTRDELEARGKAKLASRVEPYRAGYTSWQRRNLQQRLTAGELSCIVTTNALELGIDVGLLDASVVVTFPGTIASLKQMWGRAGRSQKGYAVFVAGEDALDQYFCRHPEELLDRPVEAAITNFECEPILDGHLLCAAHQAGLKPELDSEYFGPRALAHCEHLERKGDLVLRRGSFVLRDWKRRPASTVSLRGGSTQRISIVDVTSGEELGHVERDQAPASVHTGAVYLHQGAEYVVQQLDLQNQMALVEPFTGSWWTEPKREIEVEIDQVREAGDYGEIAVSFGQVTVTDTVLGYQRRRKSGGQIIDLKLDPQPPVSYSTEAVWWEPGSLLSQDPAMPSEHWLGALHAAEHAQIAMLPLLCMCDRWDIGGLSTNLHPQLAGPVVIVYEGHVGGVGIARQAFWQFDEWVKRTLTMINECDCEGGCPSCVQSPKCGNLNEPLHKLGSIELLQRLSSQR